MHPTVNVYSIYSKHMCILLHMSESGRDDALSVHLSDNNKIQTNFPFFTILYSDFKCYSSGKISDRVNEIFG